MNSVKLILLEVAAGVALATGYFTLVRPNAQRVAPKVPVTEAMVVVPPTEVVAPPPDPAPVASEAPVAPVAAVAKPAVKPVVRKPAPVPAAVRPPVAVVKHAPVPVAAELKASLAPTPLPTPAPVSASAPDLIQRGMASLNAKQWPLALEAFEAARRLQPANPDLGYLRGLALENLGQPGAAIDAYQSCSTGPYASVAKSHVKLLLARIKASK